MIRISTFAAALAVIVSPFSAQAQNTAAYDAIVQGFIAVDCVIDSEEAANRLLEVSGVSEEVARAVTDDMLAAGTLVERQDVVTLLHPQCPGGAAPAASGWVAAIDWMDGLSDVRAGDVLAEVLTARGCTVADSEFGAFEEEVATAIATRFGFDLQGSEFEHVDAFFEALDRIGNLGGEFLMDAGRIEETADQSRLIGCVAQND